MSESHTKKSSNQSSEEHFSKTNQGGQGTFGQGQQGQGVPSNQGGGGSIGSGQTSQGGYQGGQQGVPGQGQGGQYQGQGQGQGLTSGGYLGATGKVGGNQDYRNQVDSPPHNQNIRDLGTESAPEAGYTNAQSSQAYYTNTGGAQGNQGQGQGYGQTGGNQGQSYGQTGGTGTGHQGQTGKKPFGEKLAGVIPGSEENREKKATKNNGSSY